nr:DUF4469 domain-containing protein [Chryseobacterium taichungense]
MISLPVQQASVASMFNKSARQPCSVGGADISASSMEHATELFLKEMAYQLCDGFSVNTGYFTASTTIRGVFDSPSETFNKDKHSIIFQFNQGEKLRAEIPNIEVNILGVAESSAVILQVTDVKSGSVNDLLTPGRNLKIVGSKIKVAGEDSSVGIYFVDVATQERTKVEPSDIVTNNPSELILVIPALAAGTYNLEVVTQYGGGTPLKDARTATLDKILTVA